MEISMISEWQNKNGNGETKAARHIGHFHSQNQKEPQQWHVKGREVSIFYFMGTFSIENLKTIIKPTKKFI